MTLRKKLDDELMLLVISRNQGEQFAARSSTTLRAIEDVMAEIRLELMHTKQTHDRRQNVSPIDSELRRNPTIE